MSDAAERRSSPSVQELPMLVEAARTRFRAAADRGLTKSTFATSIAVALDSASELFTVPVPETLERSGLGTDTRTALFELAPDEAREVEELAQATADAAIQGSSATDSEIAAWLNEFLTHLNRLCVRLDTLLQDEESRGNPVMYHREKVETVRAGVESDLRLLAITRTTAAVDEIEEARRNVQVSAGGVADNKLAQAFKLYADKERRAANGFRLLTFVLLLAITGYAVYVTRGAANDTLAEALSHGILTLSGALLAGYSAREAAQHRRTSRWAQAIDVQLTQFGAFTEPMTDADSSALRMDFGRHVFIGTPESVTAAEPVAGPGLDPVLMQELVRLLRQQRAQ